MVRGKNWIKIEIMFELATKNSAVWWCYDAFGKKQQDGGVWTCITPKPYLMIRNKYSYVFKFKEQTDATMFALRWT